MDAVRRRHPELRQVACFDTAFHQTMPAEAYSYAIDDDVAARARHRLRAARDVDDSVSELHIVGGLHPKLLVDYYEELFRALKKRFPRIRFAPQ